MVVSIQLDVKSTQIHAWVGNLKVGRYERDYCEITPYRAFIGKQNGVMIIVNKVNM